MNKNKIVVKGSIAYLSLYDKHNNQIAEAIIDTKNIILIKNYKWYLRSDGYVATTNYNGEYQYLHKVICNNNTKKYIDHIDRNKLNNTESNLREASGSENQMNKGLRSNNKSGKAGVFWSKQNNKWRAMITIRKKRISLGYFKKFEDAVQARKEAEEKYFKKFKPIDETIIYS